MYTFSAYKKLLVITTLVISLFGFLTNHTYAQNKNSFQEHIQAEQKAQEEYESKKDEIAGQIETIENTLDEIAQSHLKVGEEKNNLATQVNSIKTEQREIDNLITETRIVINQIEKQIRENQEQIDTLNKEIKSLVKEIQRKDANNVFKLFLTSDNLGDVLSELYTLNSSKDKIQEKRDEINKINEKLEENKKQNTKIKEQLERSRSLLRSKESNLSVLISETEGEQSKYAELLESIRVQKNELENQLGSIEGEYLAEISDLQYMFQDEYDSNASCSFEEKTKIKVPEDFFGKPTTGYLTQPFHCGHDGVDIANQAGTDITSIADGTVERKGANNNGCIGIGCNGGFGNYVVVKHTLPNERNIYSLYAHLQNPSFKEVGQEVKKGEVIGGMGCTGYTRPYPCGVHLHFVLLSDSYEKSGVGCRLGGATCYNPIKYIPFN